MCGTTAGGKRASAKLVGLLCVAESVGGCEDLTLPRSANHVH